MLVVPGSAAAGHVRWQGAGLFLAQTQVSRWRELERVAGPRWPACCHPALLCQPSGHFGKIQMIYSV